jgi:hypothetical protein
MLDLPPHAGAHARIYVLNPFHVLLPALELSNF